MGNWSNHWVAYATGIVTAILNPASCIFDQFYGNHPSLPKSAPNTENDLF